MHTSMPTVSSTVDAYAPREIPLYRRTSPLIGLALVLTLTLTRGGIAQQPQHQHLGATPASPEQPAATDSQEQEQAPMRQHMQHMMRQMQDMMQHMRGMMG